LILRFVAGGTQDRARRALALGLVVTMSALLGYFWMSNGPFEGIPLARTAPRMWRMMRSDLNVGWIAAGAITGLVFAYLGHRWRVARSWVGAALVSSALLLEPFARATVGWWAFGALTGSKVVWALEVAVGAMAAAIFAVTIVSDRRGRATDVV
jgi:hypothetical protein